jgi:uracil-DNA glycosylase family 4
MNEMNPEQAARWQRLEEKLTACRACPRLVEWREEVARTKRRAFQNEVYWGKPVPGFGDPQARVLVVGLAPGAHGANRTGRVFTGDSSGSFLFRALHRAGMANQPTALHAGDGLQLHDVYIGAVCRCAPPANKPTPAEIAKCLPFLGEEIDLLERLKVIVFLGRIAFDHTLRLLRERGLVSAAEVSNMQFAHGAVYRLGEGRLSFVTSYHPSRQNTQTGRLTEAMFDEIWEKVDALRNA